LSPLGKAVGGNPKPWQPRQVTWPVHLWLRGTPVKNSGSTLYRSSSLLRLLIMLYCNSCTVCFDIGYAKFFPPSAFDCVGWRKTSSLIQMRSAGQDSWKLLRIPQIWWNVPWKSRAWTADTVAKLGGELERAPTESEIKLREKMVAHGDWPPHMATSIDAGSWDTALRTCTVLCFISYPPSRTDVLLVELWH